MSAFAAAAIVRLARLAASARRPILVIEASDAAAARAAQRLQPSGSGQGASEGLRDLRAVTRRACGGAALLSTPTHRLLGARERGGLSPSRGSRACLGARLLPAGPGERMDLHEARGYIAKFAGSGGLFVVGFQDRTIRVYDTGGATAGRAQWRPKMDIFARQLTWTITDTVVTSDDQTLVYSTISPVVRLVNFRGGAGCRDSVQNITDIHEAVDLASGPGDEESEGERFGVWSICLSQGGSRLVAGTSVCSVCMYDLQSGRPAFSLDGAHDDDVNSVAYLDAADQVVISGSDDSTIKLWDTRTEELAGVFYGHTEGVTSVAPRGDGRYLASNGKDQKAKLWDVRRMGDQGAVPKRYRVSRKSFDYRWQRYPYNPERVSHPHDSSVMTFMGHEVLHTLIRVKWSPVETTGQRFIYSGSANGSLIVYDIITGKKEAVLWKHTSVVRDCDWHPSEPVMASVGWDGQVVRWGRFKGEEGGQEGQLARFGRGDVEGMFLEAETSPEWTREGSFEITSEESESEWSSEDEEPMDSDEGEGPMNDEVDEDSG